MLSHMPKPKNASRGLYRRAIAFIIRPVAQRGCISLVDCFLHTENVASSILASPTRTRLTMPLKATLISGFFSSIEKSPWRSCLPNSPKIHQKAFESVLSCCFLRTDICIHTAGVASSKLALPTKFKL